MAINCDGFVSEVYFETMFILELGSSKNEVCDYEEKCFCNQSLTIEELLDKANKFVNSYFDTFFVMLRYKIKFDVDPFSGKFTAKVVFTNML